MKMPNHFNTSPDKLKELWVVYCKERKKNGAIIFKDTLHDFFDWLPSVHSDYLPGGVASSIAAIAIQDLTD